MLLLTFSVWDAQICHFLVFPELADLRSTLYFPGDTRKHQGRRHVADVQRIEDVGSSRAQLPRRCQLGVRCGKLVSWFVLTVQLCIDAFGKVANLSRPAPMRCSSKASRCSCFVSEGCGKPQPAADGGNRVFGGEHLVFGTSSRVCTCIPSLIFETPTEREPLAQKQYARTPT